MSNKYKYRRNTTSLCRHNGQVCFGAENNYLYMGYLIIRLFDKMNTYFKRLGKIKVSIIEKDHFSFALQDETDSCGTNRVTMYQLPTMHLANSLFLVHHFLLFQVTERLVHLSTADESSNGTSNTKEKKPSKAQKRRDKKAQQNKEREELIREQDIENISGARNVEFNKIKSILKENNLQIYEIPSDGNCLYKAVAHQLYKSGTCTNNEDLRKRCAQYMRGE